MCLVGKEFERSLIDKRKAWLFEVLQKTMASCYLYLKQGKLMQLPVKITSDLRLIVSSDEPLSGSEALELGTRLIEKGAQAVAREIVYRPRRQRGERHVEGAQ
jgi:hypothetical protein